MAAPSDQRRTRSKSMLSFGSVRSRKSSGGSVTKIDLTETAKEKSSRKMTSKADPTMAMNEAQPAAQALDQSTLESLRSIQHRDIHGNIITDPDRSNPTRPRLERPLDTIRSFEAAIDGSYSKRFSTRVDSTDSYNMQSRRSSYLQGYNNGNPHHRLPADGGGGGYYRNRASFARPDSYIDNNPSPPAPHYQGNRFGPRNQSDPALYGSKGQGVYPSHGYQQSYDTVTSGSGSHGTGTDQWGNSTDPSSENSSIDKIHQVSKGDFGETYGFNGFGGAPQFQGPILEEHGNDGPTYGQPGYAQSHSVPRAGHGYQGNGIPPTPPPHVHTRDSAPRVPIKLGSSAGSPDYAPDISPVKGKDMGEKRSSWLKRRFSKKH